MTLLANPWVLYPLSIVTALVAVAVAYVKWSQTYWSRRGLPAPKPTFFFGSCTDTFLQKQSFGELMIDIYDYFKKKGERHGGFYFLWMPNYFPLDPEVVKHIMQNDFNHFVDRGIYYHEKDPLSAHLFSLDGTKWRNLRVKMTPTFTSGKMKMMFDTLATCSDQLVVEMDKGVGGTVDIKDILQRFTTDIIGNCAFGLECNSLKNPDNEYTKYLRLFFVDDFWRNMMGMITFVSPEVAKAFNFKVVHPRLTKFFMNVITENVNYREKNNIHRKDFMHLLLQLKNRGKLSDDGSILRDQSDDNEEAITLDELAAQAFVFFVAGFETSSTTMTFCLYELASNPEIQERLRQEVVRVLEKHDDKLTYEAIVEMNYMEQVINETLRKYPPLPALNRICNKEYKVPGIDVVIEEGTKVWIPVMGIQRDPEFYPDPDKFDPERFSDENKRNRHPYTFIPFGEGPRICIGLRFGMMQTKVGLTALLKNYRFTLNPKTVVPLKFDPKSFIISTKGGIWLDYTRV